MFSPTAERAAPVTGRADATDRPARRRSSSEGPADRAYRRFMFPAALVYTAGFVLPSVYGVVLSFMKWAGPGTEQKWVGWRNYVRIFRDDTARQAFGNTLIIVVIGGAGVFALAFCAMAVLREMRGRAFVRAAVYLPSIISMIAIGTSLGFLLNPDGVVNRVLRFVGLHTLERSWLEPQHIFGCIVLGVIWMTSGTYIVLLMTSVDGIPQHLYEEAKLTGLTRMQQFRHITFPLSRDMISIAAVLWTVNSLRTFDIVIGFTGTAGTPTPEARTYAVQQWMTTNAQVGIPELGYGSAMATLLTVLTIVLLVLVRRMSRSERLEIS
ncbi:sugar ABC transporter permease [Streptomyces sp. NPDC046821]|uniref:carbohydrate ABC transporter permease n=1 Tax=Streptomyces sp. NPDC046821 TaxID=3154702 RepID=UPI00340C19E9